MKTITLELPDDVADSMESLSSKQKTAIALLSPLFAKTKSENLNKLYKKVDRKVIQSGSLEEEIDNLLDEIS